MTNRIYLDVDGVINAELSGYDWGNQQYGYAGQKGGHQYLINFASGMLDALSELDAEIIWLTTWRDEATKSLSECLGGFGAHFRVLHPISGVTTFPSIDWKRASIEQDLTGIAGGRMAWFDDETRAGDRQRWLTDYVPNIDPVFGIRKRNVEELAEFFASPGSPFATGTIPC